MGKAEHAAWIKTIEHHINCREHHRRYSWFKTNERLFGEEFQLLVNGVNKGVAVAAPVASRPDGQQDTGVSPAKYNETQAPVVKK
jgi:hypothetical protein